MPVMGIVLGVLFAMTMVVAATMPVANRTSVNQMLVTTIGTGMVVVRGTSQ